MAAALNTFAATIVVFSLICGGFSQCELSSLKISQRPTGDVVINCPGFTTTETVSPGIFEPTGGDLCSLNSGGPVYGNDIIKFNYASNTPCALTPSSSRISCS
ncbi:hypothetical protein MKX01_031213 [Papaver californicum]|nr:hypothetical protein MKX01_031213 [Papaver californicum]